MYRFTAAAAGGARKRHVMLLKPRAQYVHALSPVQLSIQSLRQMLCKGLVETQACCIKTSLVTFFLPLVRKSLCLCSIRDKEAYLPLKEPFKGCSSLLIMANFISRTGNLRSSNDPLTPAAREKKASRTNAGELAKTYETKESMGEVR